MFYVIKCVALAVTIVSVSVLPVVGLLIELGTM